MRYWLMVCAVSFGVLAAPRESRADLELYSSLWLAEEADSNGNLTLYANASVTSTCEPYQGVTLDLYITDPSVVLASANSGGTCSAATQTSAVINWDTMIDGEYQAIAQAHGDGGFHGCAASPAVIAKYQSVYQYDHFDAIKGKHVYLRRSEICVGVCQGPQHCSNQQCPWLYIPGFHSSRYQIFFCTPIPPWPRCSGVQPVCKMPFGTNLWHNDECD
jgi:hypothetical protein